MVDYVGGADKDASHVLSRDASDIVTFGFVLIVKANKPRDSYI
jgi:hypothetical protein